MAAVLILVLVLAIFLLVGVFKANNEMGKRVGYRATSFVTAPLATILIGFIFVVFLLLVMSMS